MSILAYFGNRVKELRLKVGMTQEALATRAELDRSYIGAVERGEKNLSLINIGKIANALDVDLSYLFGDERFSPRSLFLRREIKKPLETRFIYDVDLMEQVIAWRIAGPISEQDVQEISQKIKNIARLLNKGEIKLLIDNRSMNIDGMTYVFSPEVNEKWEELQHWLLPYINKVVVLCNSNLMRNQLDRLAKRSGIDILSKHIYDEVLNRAETDALQFLEISDSRLLLTKIEKNVTK